MEFRELTIRRREGTGKEAAKRLRRQGSVPAILYGGSAPVAVAVDPRDVMKLLHGHEGSTTLLHLRFDDATETRTAIIRDLQFDPVSESLLHVDLQEVSMDRAVTVTVAVHPVGEAAGVKEQSGILEMILREVQISCLPAFIPERIGADISGLHIGDVLTVGHLTPPEGVRILNDHGQAVATVSPPMAEEVAAPAVAAAAPAEPEVLTERKPKAEETETKEKEKK
jgi:large subunit ribosomal protein L25